MKVKQIKEENPKSVTGSIAMVVVLFALSLTSCVSNVSSQVKESNKDTTGTFDGTWIANVQRSPERQFMPGNWIANCNGSEWDFRITVADGVAKTNLRGATQPTFVSSNGDFRFDIPVQSEAKSSSGSARDITLAKQTQVIYGNFQKAKGRYTFAVAEFGNNGCTAIIEFDKA